MSIRAMSYGRTDNSERLCYARIMRNLVPLLVGYSVSLQLDCSEGFYRIVNGWAPIYFMVALTYPAYRMMRISPDSVWTPAFWLPLSSAVFYGFGPLVHVYGNDLTLWHLGGDRLAATRAELFRANALSVFGVFGVTFGFWFHTRTRANLWSIDKATRDRPVNIRPLTIAIFFIVAGGLFRYGILMPSAWGMTSVIVPGILSNLGALIDVGYAILAFEIAKKPRIILIILFWSTWPLHIFLCALAMFKSELLLALLLPVLGSYLGHQSPKRLVVNTIFLTFIYIAAQPWVLYGRGEIYARTGNIYEASYAERILIVGSYLANDQRGFASEDGAQMWWLRLHFSRAQAYGMKLYDVGRPGDTLKNSWMLFVPRLIWPSKPIIESPGREFSRLVKGRKTDTYTAMSVYGDMYWQFGWWGVVAISPVVGWLLAMMGWRSKNIMGGRQFIMFPLVLIALQTSMLGMNKYLFNGVVAVVPMYYGYLVAVIALKYFLSRFRT